MQPVLGHDIDVPAEELLEILGQGHLVEQTASGLEVHQEVEVTLRTSLAPSERAEERTSRAPCRAASRRTAARISSVSGWMVAGMSSLYEGLPPRATQPRAGGGFGRSRTATD